MAFLVQGDTPITDANAYVDTAWATAYHADRGVSFTGGAASLQEAVVRATDYLDQRFNFIGTQATFDQSTAWPRYNAVTGSGFLVSGVPLAVKRATAEYAFIALTQELNPTPTQDESGRSLISKSESVGPLSESARYSKSGAFSMPSYPKADAMLAKAGLTAGVGRIQRG